MFSDEAECQATPKSPYTWSYSGGFCGSPTANLSSSRCVN
jgi:hypothetical protein